MSVDEAETELQDIVMYLKNPEPPACRRAQFQRILTRTKRYVWEGDRRRLNPERSSLRAAG